MTTLLTVAGKLLTIGGSSTPPAAVAPSQVGNLVAGTPGSTSVALTWTAATGTAPIAYAVKVAPHGSTSFAPASGSFGASGGAVTGLTGATAYDIQVVATNAVGSSTTTLLNITTAPAPAIVVPPPSTNATRYDIIPDQSSVAPGSTASFGLFPNSGLWSGGTVTLTRANGSTIAVTLPSSGSAKVPFSFTAAGAGEETLTATNTAGLRNPSPALLTVFVAGAGAAGSLSLGTLPTNYRPQRTFQQCVWSGVSGTFAGVGGVMLGNGWGKLKVPIASAASALFARLTDADSAGATTSSGGTVLTNVAQVYGPVAAGTVATLLLPASDYCVYLDLATDAAFTNPVRLPVPFFLRDVAIIVTRSQENMLFGDFATGVPGDTRWSSYTKTTGFGAQNTGYGVYELVNNTSWLRCDGVQTYGSYGQGYGGVGAQELGRIFAAKKGTGLGIVGLTPAGGSMDQFWGEDGSPCSSLMAMLGEIDFEARYLVFESNGWDGKYAPESAAEYHKVYQAIPGKMMSICPSIAVVSGNSASGYFGSDGSRDLGYTRENAMIRELEQADPCVTAAECGSDWNDYYSNSGHASMASAIRYARARARSLLLAEGAHAGGYGRGYADRYVRFGVTATMAAGSGLIKVPFTLPPGASNLVALFWSNTVAKASDWTYTTPTAAKLAQLVTVYQGANVRFVDPGPSNNPAGTTDPVIQVSGVTIDNAAGTLNIAVPPGTAAPLSIQILADFGRSTGFAVDQTTWVGLFDDRDLGAGSGYGPGVRPQLDVQVSA